VDERKEAEEEEEVHELLVVTADTGSKCPLRIIKLSNFLKERPFLLIALWLKLLSKFMNIRHCSYVC
jgi:hypothetical protein